MFIAGKDVWVPRQRGKAAARPKGSLTALERRVVALSLFDPRSTVVEASWLMRLCIRAFGLRPANQLADRRLEALRRYGVLLRLSGAPAPASEQGGMIAAGFADTALNEVAHLISTSSRVRQAGRAGQ